MQGLYGGFSNSTLKLIEGSNLPYADNYHESKWKSEKCQIGCFDFEFRENIVYESDNYVIGFFGEVFGIVDDTTNTMEDYHVRNAFEMYTLIRNRGEGTIKNLNGAFVLTIYEKTAEELRIYNDRFGIYPLYYTVLQDDSYYFSQDVILLKQIICFKPDYIGMAEYLSFDYCLEDRTFFENIKYILPAQRFVINKDGILVETYWSLPKCEGNKTKTKCSYLEELNTLYRDSVLRRRGSQVTNIGLSGGFDSRLILAILNGENVSTYNFGSEESGDVIGAKALAKAYSTNHHYLIFDSIDYNEIARETVIRTGGQCHHEEFYQLLAAKEKSKSPGSVEVAGIGGDAISGQKSNFTGLIPIMSATMTRLRKKRHRHRLIKDIARGRQPACDSKYYGPIITEKWKGLDNDYNRAIDEAENGITYGNYTMRLKMRSIERRLTMPSMDITDQFIPVRLPIYDYRVINFFNSIPQTYRFGQRLYIRLIQDYYPKAAACPHSETGRPIKEVHCVMTDFVTVVNFLRGKLGHHKTKYTNSFQFADDVMLNNPKISDIVCDQVPTDHGIFNLDYYGSVDNIIRSAREGDGEAIKLLKNIIQFSIINDVYFNGDVSMYYRTNSCC